MQDSVLIIGGSAAGLRAALNLADSGYQVYFTEQQPFILHRVQDISIKTQFNQIAKHPNIRTWLNTQVSQIHRNDESISVELLRKPRFVDMDRCTACGECLTACPVTIPGTGHKAIYMDGVPECMAIEKRGRSPCASACPSGVHVQGYIALIAQGRYQEAINLIREVLPFPSVCGRVCNHQCEMACSRGEVDEAVNIMALKRYAADWAYQNRSEQNNQANKTASGNPSSSTGKRVAVIGAGPAGLTAARGLKRAGHEVTVFDALPAAGGMMRVGIPPHRLPSYLIDWEIQQILDEGVELKLNTRIIDIPALLEDDFSAVLIATGAHKAKKLRITNAEHPDNWLSLDFLRNVRFGEDNADQEQISLLGKRVVILGGGNVALDCARAAVRLAAEEVRVACLEPRGEMPGFEWEIQVAEEEGVEFFPGRTFKEVVVEEEQIVGLRCVQVDFHGFVNGLPKFDEISGTEHVLPADVVVWAIGQAPDLSLLPGNEVIETSDSGRITTDENMMATLPGVFVAGDVRRGQTFFVVDAIAEGNRVARSIDRYLRGEAGMQEPIHKTKVELSREIIGERMVSVAVSPKSRTKIASIPLRDRVENFNEVELTFTKDEAAAEARRCLSCGPCSECFACVEVCSANAILHDQQEVAVKREFGAVIYANGVDNFKTLAAQERRGIYCAAPDNPLEGAKAAAKVMSDLRRPGGIVIQQAGDFDQNESERIGVLVCECGGAISNYVDVQLVCEMADSWPGVVYSQSLSHSCLPESSQVFAEIIATHRLDKVVLGACSCCTLDQVCDSCTFQRVRAKKNIGIYLSDGKKTENLVGFRDFELVNIREQCAWVHSNDHSAATGKAIALVRAAAARARVRDFQDITGKLVEERVLVLGNGSAASACRQTLGGLAAEADFCLALPEKIKRSDGQYQVYAEGKWLASSCLVIAPANKTEERELLAALGLGNSFVVSADNKDGLYAIKPGVFLCDPEVEPSLVGTAAAAHAIAWTGQVKSRGLKNEAYVIPSYCRACGTCIKICEFGAPELAENENGDYVRIDPVICQGCGTCIAHCPSGAIRNQMVTSAQLAVSLKEICNKEKWSQEMQRIIVLTCNWNGYRNLESAGKKHTVYSPTVFPLRVSCLGEINPGTILQAFQFGADGVLMLGCKEDECHYCFGSRSAEDVFVDAQDLVRLLGYPDDSLKIVRLGIGDDVSFENIINSFVNKVGEV